MEMWARVKNVAVVAVVIVASGGTCTPVAAKGPSEDSRFESPVAWGDKKGKGPDARDFQPFAEKWVYASATSAIVYWQTGEHARNAETAGTGYVEYGPTEAYGKRTAEFSLPPVCDEVPAGVRVFQKPSWSQCHRIAGLESGRTYHYRLVFTDPDNTMVKSEDMTFTTKPPASAIRVPQSVQGPPYVLDEAGAVYVLTEDVTADGTAFDIRANNVTLDLDGHKVVYGLGSEDASHGVVAKSKRGLRLVNGVVHQGSTAVGKSYPVFLSGCAETEVCGLDVKYGDTDGQDVLFAWAKEDNNVHHNVILDTGTTTTSRHQQINVIALPRGGSGARVHHNLILRCRQSGISISGPQQRAVEGNPEGSNFEIYNKASARGLVFKNNRVASSRSCVVLSESHGCGSSDVKFVGNTFVRAGGDLRFVLLSCGFWDKPTTGSALIDSRFEGGTGYDSVVFSGTAERNFSVGWTLTLKRRPGAPVPGVHVARVAPVVMVHGGRQIRLGRLRAHQDFIVRIGSAVYEPSFLLIVHYSSSL